MKLVPWITRQAEKLYFNSATPARNGTTWISFTKKSVNPFLTASTVHGVHSSSNKITLVSNRMINTSMARGKGRTGYGGNDPHNNSRWMEDDDDDSSDSPYGRTKKISESRPQPRS
jgi:hypothetical protein